MDDMKKRTEKMMAEARKKLLIHESLSREDTKRPIPLSMKLKVALPLAGMAIALYIASFSYTKRRHGDRFKQNQPPTVLTDVRDLHPIDDTIDDLGPRFVAAHQQDLEELMVDDVNKKW